jgi:outer membrane protein TolC
MQSQSQLAKSSRNMTAVTTLLSLLLVANVGQAETLAQAWQLALDTDLALQSANSQVEAAESELAVAKSRRYPVLSANGSITRMDETPAFDFGAAGIPVQLPLYTGSTVTATDAMISVPLFTSGALSNGIAAAQGGLGSSRHQARSVAMDTKLAIADAYINVLRSESALNVEDMFNAGLVPRNDYLSAQVALADASQRNLQATNQLDIARAAYNRGVGRELQAPVNLDSGVPLIGLDFGAENLESLSALALEQRPELAGMQEGATALRAQAKAAKARGLPQVALTGGYTYLDNQFLNQEDFWMVGVGVHWDLFDSGRTRHAADALSRRARAASQSRGNMESLIALQVRQSWLEQEEARQRLKVVARAVEQSQENLRVVRDRYRNGEGTNTEVLEAQNLSNLSQQNYDNARYDIELSRIRLARAVGLL